MKFPGDNEITLTEPAIRELLKSQAPTLFGDPAARITKIQTKTYPAGLVVTFTTDPEPGADPVELPPRRLSRTASGDGLALPAPGAPALPDDDDGHPF